MSYLILCLACATLLKILSFGPSHTKRFSKKGQGLGSLRCTGAGPVLLPWQQVLVGTGSWPRCVLSSYRFCNFWGPKDSSNSQRQNNTINLIRKKGNKNITKAQLSGNDVIIEWKYVNTKVSSVKIMLIDNKALVSDLRFSVEVSDLCKQFDCKYTAWWTTQS